MVTFLGRPKFLVTGGAGFIGSNIVQELLMSDVPVRVLDNFKTGLRENIEDVTRSLHPYSYELEVIEGSIIDPETCKRAVTGVDYVLHQAAIPSVPRSVAFPVESNEANVTGTLNMLMACRGSSVKRFVYAASSSAYGNTPDLPKVESQRPQPRSPYAAQKLLGEHYCSVFHELYGVPTVSLRYFNVFGPRQNPNSSYAPVVPKFITCLLKGERPPVHGTGEQSRDFSYVSNVVHANICAIHAPDTALGRVFNVACGDRHSLNEMLRELAAIMDVKCEPEHTPQRPGDVMHTQADISAAKKVLGYESLVTFRDGLRKTVEWYREKNK